MTNQTKKPTWFSKILTGFSSVLRAIWLFFPGVLFAGLGFMAFALIEQGQDLVRQSLQLDPKSALIPSVLKIFLILLGLIFWSFTTWYTSRILAYNDNKIYDNSKFLATLMPRLLGYMVFTISGIAVNKAADPDSFPWWFIALSLGLFALVFWLAQNKSVEQKGLNTLFKHKNAKWGYLIFSLSGVILIGSNWVFKKTPLILVGFLLIQLGMILWVSFRQPSERERGDTKEIPKIISLFSKVNQTLRELFKIKQKEETIFSWIKDKVIFDYKCIVKCIYRPALLEDKDLAPEQITVRKRMSEEEKEIFLSEEYKTFLVYNLFAVIALSIYSSAVFWVNCGRSIGAWAFTLIAFGVLVGVGNIIALMSFRTKINWLLVFFVTFILLGKVTEPHEARIIPLQSQNVYSQRPSLKEYLEKWAQDPTRKKALESSIEFPLIFVLADGGASRSGYWAASVLGKLHEETDSSLLHHLFMLAGASGGSVGNTTFLAALMAQSKYPNSSVDSICSRYLGNDFLTYPLARYLGPEFINLGQWPDRAAALEQSMENPKILEVSSFSGYPSVQDSILNSMMGKIMSRDFNYFIPTPKSKNIPPILCINTTCMQNSRPGIICNIKDSVFDPRLDVLTEMNCRTGIRVSTAMVLGARFPYFSPAGRLAEKYYVDGGYFDNSGAGPVLQVIVGLETIKKQIEKAGQENSYLYKVLKKMKYHVIHLQNNPLKKTIEYPKVLPFLNDLAAPIFTLMRSYGAQTSFNDHRLKIQLNEIGGEYHALNLYQKETDAFPMSWYLSKPAIDSMNARVASCPGIQEIKTLLKKDIGKSVKGLGKTE